MEYKIGRTNELTHHGVIGMKWGVRRYQRRDGTLTALGKKHLERQTEKAKAEARILKNRKATKDKFDKLAAKQKANEDLKKELDGEKTSITKRLKKNDQIEKPAVKSLGDMTDEELRAMQSRLQSQKNIMDLERQIAAMTPKQVTRREKVIKALSDTVLPQAQKLGTKLVTDWFEKKGKELLGINTLDEYAALKKEVDKLDLMVKKKDYLNKLNGNNRGSEAERMKKAKDFWLNASLMDKSMRDYYNNQNDKAQAAENLETAREFAKKIIEDYGDY